MSSEKKSFYQRFELSLFFLIVGIVTLYAIAIAVTLISPRFIDPTWQQPSSYYQVQMYEVADPNFFISSESSGVKKLEYVHRLKKGETLLAFEESDTLKIVAIPDLQRYITKAQEKPLKLTSKLLFLREPEGEAIESAKKLKAEKSTIDFQVKELYDPEMTVGFSLSHSDGVIEDFVDSHFEIIDKNEEIKWHNDPGVIFVKNPEEYRIQEWVEGGEKIWRYHPQGTRIADEKELTGTKLGFRSRKELIQLGEQIYAVEGCWYCHTDQTRTLVQDVVLNGSEFYPAPPSSPKEYIYQKVTFPGTRRIGPDLSRTGIKRASRDWHKAHFWSPKTASMGSIMPSFQHFFDFDPRGTAKSTTGVPNFQFEAIYQYLMTKGTRITPPTEAWWLGKDPVDTIQLIERVSHGT